MMFGEYSESSGSRTKPIVVVRMSDAAHGKKIWISISLDFCLVIG